MITPLVVNEIATFAARHNVPVELAHTLPAIFNKIAEIGNKPVRAIISQATYSNVELAEYIKELAAQVA